MRRSDSILSYTHPDDAPLLSSVSDVQAFKESLTWRDIRAMLEDRLKGWHEQMESSEMTPEKWRRAQGILANVRDMLDLPDQLIEWIESEQQREESDDE